LETSNINEEGDDALAVMMNDDDATFVTLL